MKDQFRASFIIKCLVVSLSNSCCAIAPCTLIQHNYTLGAFSDTTCWKESTQQLWVGIHGFSEGADEDMGSYTTVYNCLPLD